MRSQNYLVFLNQSLKNEGEKNPYLHGKSTQHVQDSPIVMTQEPDEDACITFGKIQVVKKKLNDDQIKNKIKN